MDGGLAGCHSKVYEYREREKEKTLPIHGCIKCNEVSMNSPRMFELRAVSETYI